MNEPQPLDLRSLAEVDDPEVVRAALKAFRRRIWTRYLWILGVVAILIAAVISLTRPHDLADRIQRGTTIAYPGNGAVYAVGRSRIALTEVADLGATTGIEFTVVGPPSGPSAIPPPPYAVRVAGSLHTEQGQTQTWVEVPKTPSGVLHVRLTHQGPCTKADPCAATVTVDLARLNLPATVWRPS
jgi:hypothetical protein